MSFRTIETLVNEINTFCFDDIHVDYNFDVTDPAYVKFCQDDDSQLEKVDINEPWDAIQFKPGQSTASDVLVCLEPLCDNFPNKLVMIGSQFVTVRVSGEPTTPTKWRQTPVFLETYGTLMRQVEKLQEIVQDQEILYNYLKKTLKTQPSIRVYMSPTGVYFGETDVGTQTHSVNDIRYIPDTQVPNLFLEETLLGKLNVQPPPQPIPNWDKDAESRNINITLEKLLEKPDDAWNWELLSENDGVNDEMVLAQTNRPWNWFKLSHRPKTSFSLVAKYFNCGWDWDYLSSLRVSVSILEAHPYFPWNFDILSKNLSLTDKPVLENPDLKWNWALLSKNPFVSFDVVFALPNKSWDWRELSNCIITMKLFKKHLGLPWDWTVLSSNSNVTGEFVIGHAGLPWDWSKLSENRSIKPKTVLESPHLPWNLEGLKKNPSFSTIFKQ